MHFSLSPFLLIALSSSICAYKYSSNTNKVDDNTVAVEVTFNLAPNEYLYKDSFLPSVNSPDIKLSEPKVQGQALSFFDPSYKKNKEGYKDKVSFTFTAHKEPVADKEIGEPSKPSPIAKANATSDNSSATGSSAMSDKLNTKVGPVQVHTHFSVSSTTQPQEKTVTLTFEDPSVSAPEVTQSVSNKSNKDAASDNEQQTTAQQSTTVQHDLSCDVPQPSFLGNFMQRTTNYIRASVDAAKHKLSSLFTSTGSHAVRIIVALILGLLLSLTPCIYPMIPITVGILQANTSKSPIRNFLLASSYTLGISLTFALLGLIAALGSCVFGTMQGSPWIVIPLIAMLFYFGGSMFGLYEIYIPRFLQPKGAQVKGGSFLSAFIFGSISGTVASPCLSPGLALILNYVGHLSSSGSAAGYIEGFLLLFFFGIGSSLPLLIIGTFSSSINLLPKAGMWMVEVKKLFGIMLFGMGFYHLSHLERLFPWYILVWVLVASLFALGVYYFMSITSSDSVWGKRYKSIMGIIFIMLACIMSVQGYKSVYEHYHPEIKHSSWLDDYKKAFEQAQKEHKKLFIDIGATYCSACKSLDKAIFQNDKVVKALAQYIPLKIESDTQTTQFEDLKKSYGKQIAGFPTYLIIDTATNTVTKKWGVEIEDLSIDGLIDELNKLK